MLNLFVDKTANAHLPQYHRKSVKLSVIFHKNKGEWFVTLFENGVSVTKHEFFGSPLKSGDVIRIRDPNCQSWWTTGENRLG